MYVRIYQQNSEYTCVIIYLYDFAKTLLHTEGNIISTFFFFGDEFEGIASVNNERGYADELPHQRSYGIY